MWKQRKDSYVAHKPRPYGNVIFPVSLGPGCSLRLIATSLNASSSLAALYLCLTPNPNRNVEIIRGFPKTSCPSLRYSKRQSGTVIRNRPNMIAMSLRLISAKLLTEDERKPTLLYLSRRCDRNNDKEDIYECDVTLEALIPNRRPHSSRFPPLLLEELDKHFQASLADESCDRFLPSPLRRLCNR